MSKALKVISILLAALFALNFGYAYAQQPYAQTLDEISGRLPGSWHGFDQLSKQVSGQSLNGIWFKQEGKKYRTFQIIIDRFASKTELEDARGRYEGGQGARDFAGGLAGDVLPRAQTSTSTIAGSKVFTLTSSSAALQIDQLGISTGIYYDYGIFVWTCDAPATSSAIWAEVAGFIGQKAGESKPTPPPSPPPSPPPEPKPEPAPTPAPSPALDMLVSKVDEAEQTTLEILLREPKSIYELGGLSSVFDAALQARIELGYAVGLCLEKYDVDLGDLKELLPADIYQKLDTAFDLEAINSLRRYCGEGNKKVFTQEYLVSAKARVRGELFFDAAESRVKQGFKNLKKGIESGNLGADQEAMQKVLDNYMLVLHDDNIKCASDLVSYWKGASEAQGNLDTIDKLFDIFSDIIPTTLTKARLSARLSFLATQAAMTYWTPMVFIWGGTEEVSKTTIETLRQKGNYALGGGETFKAGIVFAAEVGLEKMLRGEEIE